MHTDANSHLLVHQAWLLVHKWRETTFYVTCVILPDRFRFRPVIIQVAGLPCIWYIVLDQSILFKSTWVFRYICIFWWVMYGIFRGHARSETNQRSELSLHVTSPEIMKMYHTAHHNQKILGNFHLNVNFYSIRCFQSNYEKGCNPVQPVQLQTGCHLRYNEAGWAGCHVIAISPVCLKKGHKSYR